MHFLLAFLIALFARTLHASLVCLQSPTLSKSLGVPCFLAPDSLTDAVLDSIDTVQSAIETVGQDSSHNVDFNVTTQPAGVEFVYLTAPDPDQYLLDTTKERDILSLRLDNATVAQLIRVTTMTYWLDESLCFVEQVGQALKTNQSGDAISKAVLAACLTSGYTEIAAPKEFNIEAIPEQEYNLTIAEIAPLLLPVESIDGLHDYMYDLAIAGSENDTRIYKWTGDSDADHFEDQWEAAAVLESLMGEDGWADSNCGVCQLPSTVSGITRRGGSTLGTCCRTPPRSPRTPRTPRTPRGKADVGTPDAPDVSEITMSPDSGSPLPKSGSSTPRAQTDSVQPVWDPSEYKNIIPESKVTPPPTFTSLALEDEGFGDNLKESLRTKNTALVAWPESMKVFWDSKRALEEFRYVFENEHTWEDFVVLQRNGKARLEINTARWMGSSNMATLPFQIWVNDLTEYGKDVLLNAMDLGDTDREAFRKTLIGRVQVFYSAAHQQGLAGFDRRGLHTDRGYMQLIVFDTPGLVVRNDLGPDGKPEYWRVPVVDDAFYCAKARRFDWPGFVSRKPNTATPHSVFGPEMALKSRVSIILTIADPDLERQYARIGQ